MCIRDRYGPVPITWLLPFTSSETSITHANGSVSQLIKIGFFSDVWMVSFWPSAFILEIFNPDAARSFFSIKRSKQAFTAAASTFLPLENVTLSLMLISHVVSSTSVQSVSYTHLCASHGLLTYPQFVKLKEAGVTRYHNNLETSRRNFPNICTTHTYDDKIQAIKHALKAGLERCV